MEHHFNVDDAKKHGVECRVSTSTTLQTQGGAVGGSPKRLA